MYVKEIRNYATCLALFLSLMLPLMACAQEHRHSPRGEIIVTNDTETQVTYFITTEKHGRRSWTATPGYNKYPALPDMTHIMVRGDDEIEIGDFGKAYIRDVAQFRDGVWKLSIRHARRELRHDR